MISALIEFLAAYYQQDDVTGIIGITRNILNVIPDDLVALQFMALALLQIGRKKAAISLFYKASGLTDIAMRAHEPIFSVCVPASCISYREATRPDSGLGEGWRNLGIVLDELGFHRLAERARAAAVQTLATPLNTRLVPLFEVGNQLAD